MENDTIISHVPDADNTCKSVRSKKKINERCKNPASHGSFCGIHNKNPIIWKSTDSSVADKPPSKKLMKAVISGDVALRIQKWYRAHRGMYFVRHHGIGYWDRSILTNDTDFFSTDRIQDISGSMFLSYKDEQNHVYGFDIRSLNSLYTRSSQINEPAQNPFTRTDLPEWLEAKKTRIVDKLTKKKIPTDWIPITPPTPEQQWRMKVVDIFHKIDELNYYSSPDWFIGLNHHGQGKFYHELFDIWVFRAGLSMAQKNAIVPQHNQKLFKYSPLTVSVQPIGSIQKINMNTIRLMISSAEDRNDRILGAMYVITAFTIVNRQARIAYPWLYDSVAFQEPTAEEIFLPNQNQNQNQNIIQNPFDHIFGINWLQGLLFEPMPSLNLDNPNPNPNPSQD